MATYWYHNSKTGEIESYRQEGELTDFNRGTFLAYGDYLTTGIKSLEEAKKWAKEWGACHKCRATRHPKDGKCPYCKEEIEFVPIKIIN